MSYPKLARMGGKIWNDETGEPLVNCHNAELAQLFAAAPDLLRACNLLAAQCWLVLASDDLNQSGIDNADLESDYQFAVAAIARAEGRQP